MKKTRAPFKIFVFSLIGVVAVLVVCNPPLKVVVPTGIYNPALLPYEELSDLLPDYGRTIKLTASVKPRIEYKQNYTVE